MKYTACPMNLTLHEIKSEKQEGLISGYASIFGVLDEQGDRVMNGAFQKSLSQWRSKGRLPKMLWQHDPKHPIGQWTKIEEDEKGLYVEGKLLLDLQKGREAYALLKEGIIEGLSIGYRVQEALKSSQNHERLLSQLDLHEVSLVTFAANPNAHVMHVKGNHHYEDSLINRLQRLITVLSAAS